MADFRIELITGLVERTSWWKDENKMVPANVWWLYGPGVSRPATDIEIDLWKQGRADTAASRPGRARASRGVTK